MQEIVSFLEFNQYNLGLIIQFLLGYVAFIWLAVTVWVLRDISRRTSNLFVIIMATTFVAVGSAPALIIYLLVRPESTIEEAGNKDLFYASVIDKDISACPTCSTLVRNEFSFCPNCSTYLEISCPHCYIRINSQWKFCANCNLRLEPESKFTIWWRRLKNNTQIYTNSFSNLLGLYWKFIRVNASKKSKLKFVTRKIKLNRLNIKFNIRVPHVSLRQNDQKIKVMAVRRHEITPQPTVQISEISLKADSLDEHEQIPADKSADIHREKTKIFKKQKLKNSRKKGRGRPKGSSDNRPRKKRSDAGKTRGSYNT